MIVSRPKNSAASLNAPIKLLTDGMTAFTMLAIAFLAVALNALKL